MKNLKSNQPGNVLLYLISVVIIICLTQCKSKNTTDKEAIKAEIEKILKVQEDAYAQNKNNDVAKVKYASTCDDSLLSVGGDDGGLARSANFYVHDLADGYVIRPHDKVFRIYDQTVIVTSVLKAFVVLKHDTIYYNIRQTKVFVKENKDWKMAFVTYAPLPVIYTKRQYINPKIMQDYVGLYEGNSTIPDTVAIVEGKLIINGSGNNKSELIPINDSTFIGNDYFGKTVFTRNNKGIVNGNYFESPDGQRVNFLKIK